MPTLRREKISAATQELSLLVRGGDPTLVLLHGLAGHGGEWSPSIDALDEDLGVIVPDLPGHGASYRADGSPMTRESAVADVLACIDQLHATKVTLVGQSMGGIIATLVAAERPDTVDNLVLVDAGVSALEPDGLDRLGAWFDSWPDVFADADAARDFFGREAASTPQWVAGLERTDAGLVARFDAQQLLATIENLASSHHWDAWDHLEMPVVVLRASHGMLSEDDAQEMVDRNEHAELITVFSGHDIHLDEPGFVASVLDRVVRGSDA